MQLIDPPHESEVVGVLTIRVFFLPAIRAASVHMAEFTLSCHRELPIFCRNECGTGRLVQRLRQLFSNSHVQSLTGRFSAAMPGVPAPTRQFSRPSTYPSCRTTPADSPGTAYIKFSEVLWCSLIDHVSVPTGGKKSLIFHLRNGGAIDIVLDQ